MNGHKKYVNPDMEAVTAPAPAEQPAKKLALASLIVSIGAVVLLSLPAGIVAIVLAVKARKQGHTTPMPTVAIAVSILAMAVSLFVTSFVLSYYVTEVLPSLYPGLFEEEVTTEAELTDEQAVDTPISEGQEADLPHPAEDQQHDGRGNDGAVDGKAAVTVAQDGAPVQTAVRQTVTVQIEQDVIGPDGNKGGGDGEEHHIQDLILVDAKAGAPLAAQINRQDQARGDDDAVPVDGAAEEFNRHPVEFKLKTQAGERNKIGHACSPLGRTMDRAVRAGTIHFSISSSASFLVRAS